MQSFMESAKESSPQKTPKKQDFLTKLTPIQAENNSTP